jgi:ariadne-1
MCGLTVQTVRCDCGHPYCFKCGEEAHDPTSCAQLAVWTEKCSNESETANWILANTKKCPKCNARIEKNQGCNHMNCKLCKHEFCWICMGDWLEHGQNTGGFYKCNRYDVKADNSSATAAQKAKAELDRYLHYYQRFHGHDSSLKFAASLREAAERRMIMRQESEKSSWMDVQFLKQAAELVIECRRVLKYTYVLGYSLPDDTPIKQLFEHHQEMLEKNTERLHEYTEQPMEVMDRTQIVNLTRVTERFMASLLGSMSGGHVDLAGPDVLLSSPSSSSSSAAAAMDH